MNFIQGVTFSMAALLLPAIALADTTDAGFGGTHLASASSGVRMTMHVDFGGSQPHANGLALAIDYDRGRLPLGVASVPLLQARLVQGKWQSLMLTGVDVLHLKPQLDANAESRNWVPWAIGGVVAAGAVAIIIRYATQKEAPNSDLRGLPTK